MTERLRKGGLWLEVKNVFHHVSASYPFPYHLQINVGVGIRF